jgi:hypothetical protein
MKWMTKYCYLEHEDAYEQIEREGKSGWDELHGGTGFIDFSSRDFLNRRHLKPIELATELQSAGFHVLWQGGQYGGDVICTRDDNGRRSG